MYNGALSNACQALNHSIALPDGACLSYMTSVADALKPSIFRW